MQRFVSAIREPNSVHLQSSMRMVRTPAHSRPQTRSMTAEIAWTKSGHIYSDVKGAGGEAILVSDGKTLYEYLPARRQVIKHPASQIPMALSMVQIQATRLLPFPAPSWTYYGVRTVDNHPCDYIQAKQQGATMNVYLDRSTHLPRWARVSQSDGRDNITMDARFPFFEVDRAIPASLFQFIPPKGSRIITAPTAPRGPAAPPRRR